MLSRRAALQGGTAIVAAIAGAGAVAARVAVDDPVIEAAAKTYWAWEARFRALLDNPKHTDEQTKTFLELKLEAYDALMEVPASNLKGLAVKAQAYRHEWFDFVTEYMDNGDLGVLLEDIERLAGRAAS